MSPPGADAAAAGRTASRTGAAEPTEVAAPRPPRPFVIALVAATRPKQWVKNVLVFAAPGAAAVLTHRTQLVQTVVAFVAFCLAASGTYFLNDAGDVEADRQHPTKRLRPIAAGEVSIGVARVVGVVLVVAGVGVSFAASWELAVVVGSYVVVTTLYTLWLKHEVLFDVVAVAAGFVLRAIGGAAATHVAVSNWFFIVATFGSLFMVSCKRHAEARTMGDRMQHTRAVLEEYSESYLSYLRAVCSGVVLVAYCLWAFEKATTAASHVPLFQLSIVPFSLAVLRYALLVDQGHGGAPEELIFGDRMLQAIGVCWAVLFALGLYFK